MLKEKDILKRYEILRLIGVGGFSRVWLAMDIHMNKQWAIKEINKKSAEYQATVNENQTLREIEIMTTLDHPALPRIVDVMDEEDALYVVMDYIEGDSLRKIIEDYGKQDQELVAAWAIELCDVLDYLHNLEPPIIYRDMKPSNVMLKPDGSVKVIDFGVARRYKEGKDDTILFMSRGYASPEHMTGKTDARSDIYCLGTTMYHLLTGEDPADTPLALKPIRQIDPSLSSGLEEIILKATNADPQKRYQSADEMMKAVANYKKLEIPYITELNRKLKVFKRLAAATLGCLVLATALFLFGTVQENSTYEELLYSETTDTELHISQLHEAVKMKPERTEGYVKLLQEYSKEGFTETEASEFLAVYNRNREYMNETSEEFAALNFEIGKDILLYYSGTSDNSTRNKLITAKSFFLAAKENDRFEKQQLAEGYCELASFYEEYMNNTSELTYKEPSAEECAALLDRMEKLITSNPDGEEGDRLKLVAATVILHLIDEERSLFARQHISKNEVNDVVNTVTSEISALGSTNSSVKEKAEQIRKRADLLKKKVEIAYQISRKTP